MRSSDTFEASTSGGAMGFCGHHSTPPSLSMGPADAARRFTVCNGELNDSGAFVAPVTIPKLWCISEYTLGAFLAGCLTRLVNLFDSPQPW